jgi:hypothetical protein
VGVGEVVEDLRSEGAGVLEGGRSQLSSYMGFGDFRCGTCEHDRIVGTKYEGIG